MWRGILIFRFQDFPPAQTAQYLFYLNFFFTFASKSFLWLRNYWFPIHIISSPIFVSPSPPPNVEQRCGGSLQRNEHVLLWLGSLKTSRTFLEYLSYFLWRNWTRNDEIPSKYCDDLRREIWALTSNIKCNFCSPLWIPWNFIPQALSFSPFNLIKLSQTMLSRKYVNCALRKCSAMNGNVSSLHVLCSWIWLEGYFYL